MVSPVHQRILSRFLPPWARCPSSYSEEVERGSPAPPPAGSHGGRAVSGASPGCQAGPAWCSQQALGAGLCASGPLPGRVAVRAGMGRQLVGSQLQSRRLSYQEGPERGGQETPPSPPVPPGRLRPRTFRASRWGPPWKSRLPLSVGPLTILVLRDGRASHQPLQPHYPLLGQAHRCLPGPQDWIPCPTLACA